ncbi:nuclear telomere cap complex subunit Ten1 [Aspergillus undulatus]|uniref:nuclear telomere cap complex subunit Ten1 n=1 Tax=Aspergillus undulatus TaxID=1810928 RepID=UPI003CCD74E2
MNSPLPSTRTFLSDIPSLPADSKVRFLGCVKTYHIPSGILVLEHNYPRTRKPKQNQTSKPKQEPPFISVDITGLLETVTWEELCVGAWVNVIGYVRRGPDTAAALALNGEKLKEAASAQTSDSVFVDAVVIFPAGAIDLGEYEQILSDALEVERMRRSAES